jgi:hypothetical protein
VSKETYYRIIGTQVPRDLVCVKRDLVCVKRDLVCVKRDLVCVKRDPVCHRDAGTKTKNHGGRQHGNAAKP